MDDLKDSLHNRQSPQRTRSNEKYSPAKITEALLAAHGLIASAARLLGCTRQTIYDAIGRHPEINAVVAGERELLLDTAERKLHEAVEAGQGWAVRFYLVTQGQARGYIERPRIEAEDRTVRVIIQRDPPTVLNVLPALPDGSTDRG
jgi:hypothetical protein